MTEAARVDSPSHAGDEARQLGELVLFHGGEWTEADYEALPPGVRAELRDGRLILTPGPTAQHMFASMTLAGLFQEVLGDRKRVLMEVDVRMADGRRYRAPDVLVLKEFRHGRPMEPANVVLVGEVVSPGGGEERGDKMTAYRDAGIEWYLIVEETPAGFLGELYRLDSDKYELVADAPPAGVLTLPAPFDSEIRLSELS
jgi:Uma2 family endonuclease